MAAKTKPNSNMCAYCFVLTMAVAVVGPCLGYDAIDPNTFSNPLCGLGCDTPDP